jgi:hypothetical protein
VPTVTDVLNRAVGALKGEPEHEVAARMLAEVPSRTEMLAARCVELPSLLATIQEPSPLLEWSV